MYSKTYNVNQTKYKDKLGRHQYLRYCNNTKSNSTKTSHSNKDNETVELAEEIANIQSQNDKVVEKLNYIIDEFNSYKNIVSDNANYTVSNDNMGLIIYDGNTQEKALVEKKGLFGLGKSKWVEEK